MPRSCLAALKKDEHSVMTMMIMEPMIFCGWREVQEKETHVSSNRVWTKEIHPVGVRDGLSVVTDLAGHNMTVVVMAVEGPMVKTQLMTI
jgi:hypothetical protein